MSRGEPLKDTARILSLYCNGIVMRTFEHERIEEMASWTGIPVINALTDLVHPCQVISDCFTLSERFGSIKDKKIAWIGDGNNMANSWINAAVLFGFDLDIACPKGYEPDRMTLDRAIDKGLKIRIVDDPIEAARIAICVNTDVWASMGQEDEHDLRAEIFSPFQVNKEVMGAADDHAVFMHCLPAHRGQEVTEQVLEGEQSIIWEQAKNRLYVQEAIMDILFSE
jgi:ornithine carbamoyltransferase